MTTTHDPCYMPAVEMAAAIRRRALSPVEVVDALLARIERVNPALNAFTVVLAEQARASARQAEEAVLRGEATGILHSVPFTIKDLTFTKGVTTARGSVAFKDFVPGENGLLVERLSCWRSSIFLAKTTSPEFGNRRDRGLLQHVSNLEHRHHGRPSGGAAQVAAGWDRSPGSDGGGSIRIPASCCGVFGLKPPTAVASFRRQLRTSPPGRWRYHRGGPR
jgi:Asp-tRNA(Asn)/Glu-tRNA(Gln) amidotransferase A subunit family amidase